MAKTPETGLCELCGVHPPFVEPWMPPASCCECGKTLCRTCMDEEMYREYDSYVCKKCSVSVYGNPADNDGETDA